MDLLDCMNKSAFLGREWMVWLWFKSELFEAPMDLGELGMVEVWLETQLTLEAGAQEVEQSLLKGQAPSTSPEAHEALRQGKLPTQARISIRRGEQTYSFAIKADTLSLSSVKLPTLVKEHTDEQFYERMYLLEELEAILEALREEFVTLRLSAEWDAELLPAIRGWVQGRPRLSRQGYEDLVHKVLRGESGLRAMGMQPAEATAPAAAPAAPAAPAPAE